MLLLVDRRGWIHYSLRLEIAIISNQQFGEFFVELTDVWYKTQKIPHPEIKINHILGDIVTSTPEKLKFYITELIADYPVIDPSKPIYLSILDSQVRLMDERYKKQSL